MQLQRVVFVSTSEIDATIGVQEKIAAGTYDVVVANPNGNVGTTTAVLRVVDPPVVDAVAVPTSGGDTICNAIDSTLTVTGTGFRPTDGETVEVLDGAGAVALTGTADDVKIVSATSLTLTIKGANPAQGSSRSVRRKRSMRMRCAWWAPGRRGSREQTKRSIAVASRPRRCRRSSA